MMRRWWWAPFLMICSAGPALAQDDLRVERWSLPGVASPMWESHPAIDPQTGALWFVRSDRKFSGWRIFTARCERGHWSTPQPMPFAGQGLEADPWFSTDGRTLWFISTRASGDAKSAALDIWRAHRDTSGRWQAPERLPAPVNSDAAEWFPRPDADGWLYFGSRRAGGFGKDDIWRARQAPDGTWAVENAGPDLNSAAAEYELQPAADGTWGILATDTGLYRAVKTSAGWRRAEKFGPQVNVNGTEIGPMVLPDGRGFVYSRDTGEQASGELFVATFMASPAAASSWSPCRAKAD